MSWFSRLSVGAKLFASFAALLAMMCVIVTVAVLKMSVLDRGVDELALNWIPARAAANQFDMNVTDHRIEEYKLLIAKDETEIAASEKAMGELREKTKENYETLESLCSSPEEEETLSMIDEQRTKYFEASQKILSLVREGKIDESTTFLAGESREARLALDEAFAKELEICRTGTEYEATTAQNAFDTGRLVTFSVFGVSVAVGLGLAFWISRWFTKAIVEVDDISASVASASQQLAAASEQLSSGAQQSASSLEETASSLEEITATVRQNADNADQANQLANSSRETAEKGGAVVAQAVDAMSEINRSSRKIADIITTIDEIAFQTNLLALNAAVEAARAGEQGRGFAVVAGEVRNLAQRSATAAREIKGLIEDSVQKVETGSELVNKSGETLGAIVTSVKRVTDIVAEIAAASREQTVGIEQINKAVAQMDQVTQSNASQTEEMSGTAVALSGQAEQLQAVVAQFNLNRDAAPAAKPTNYAPAKQPKASSYAAPSKPAKRKSAPAKSASRRGEELELVGAGVGGDGFEEF